MAQVSNSAYATNSHLFVEFELLVLHKVLKGDFSQVTKILAVLNPFVPIVNDRLRSRHAKVKYVDMCQLMTSINLWLFLVGRAGFKVYLLFGADAAFVYRGICAQSFDVNFYTSSQVFWQCFRRYF